MADEIKQATLYGAGDAKEVVDVGSQAASDFQSQGYGLTPGSYKAPEAEVINRGALQTNIETSLDKYTPAAGSNEAFIQGVSKFATGKAATAEDIAQAGTLGDVIQRYGVGEQFAGFGIQAPAQVDVSEKLGGQEVTQPVVEEPKKDGVTSAIDDLIATKQAGMVGELDINAFKTKANEAATAVEVQRQSIADKKLIDAVTLEQLGDKPIPNVAIYAKRNDFSREQLIPNLMMAQDYNNKMILSQMAQGNFMEAQRINQGIAKDNYAIESLKLDKAKQEGLIDEREAAAIEKENSYQRELAEDGYVYIADPETLKTLKAEDIYTDPVTGRMYRKPVEEVEIVGDDYTFIKGTDDQAGGVFNNTTGKFEPFDGSGAGTVATSTGDMYDIGSYATDPTHEQNIQGMLTKMGQFNSVEDIDSYIKSVAPNSPVTGDMIKKASEKHGVSWEMMVAIMQQDSSLGTKGIGARNFNPGNISQFDSLGTTPTAGYKTWQEGVDAVAANLAWRKVGGGPEEVEVKTDPEVAAYAEQVKKGNLTDLQALQQVDKDKKAALVSELAKTSKATDNKNDIAIKSKIQKVLALKEHKGLKSSVGPVAGTRMAILDKFGAKDDFIGKVDQLTSALGLDSLIEAKSRGATFGALSDREMTILINAMTALGGWEVRDQDTNKVKYYDIDEKSFKEELNNITKALEGSLKRQIVSGDTSTVDPLGILDLGADTANSTNPLGI